MAGLLRAFNSALIRRPLLTQCTTSAVIFGTGDVIAQQLIEKKGGPHDFARTARLMVYGGLFFGPPMTFWYRFLNGLKFASPTRGLAYRVWLDQAILTPVAVAYFYGSMSVLEGKIDEAIPRIQAAYVPTIIRNWAVYIPTQLLNFSVVPPHLRLVFVGGVALFWNTYLSAANAHHRKQLAAEAEGKLLID